ncbi:MAG: hypothetical protein R2910_02515 [Gemmatimonadales bacterium]
MAEQRGYNTNLASEFHVMATLARLGLDPLLTLGNKKSVDIVLHRHGAPGLTVEVKANAKKLDWILGSRPLVAPTHFFVFLGYEGRFEEVTTMPRAWIVPSERLEPLVERAGTSRMHYVRRRRVLSELSDCEGAWDQLTA